MQVQVHPLLLGRQLSGKNGGLVNCYLLLKNSLVETVKSGIFQPVSVILAVSNIVAGAEFGTICQNTIINPEKGSFYLSTNFS